MELSISVVVPRTVLNLCCRYTGKANPNEDKYRLNETDPDRFNDILKTIKSTQLSQFFIEDRPQNRQCIEAVEQYNEEHPDQKIDLLQEVIKALSVDNYKHSKMGTKGSHTGDEMHEFSNIRIPGFSKNSKWSIYFKFVTPEEGKDIDVISLHRPIDVKAR
jgi:hypothetical protein